MDGAARDLCPGSGLVGTGPGSGREWAALPFRLAAPPLAAAFLTSDFEIVAPSAAGPLAAAEQRVRTGAESCCDAQSGPASMCQRRAKVKGIGAVESPAVAEAPVTLLKLNLLRPGWIPLFLLARGPKSRGAGDTA